MSGSVSERTIALWHAFKSASFIGRMPACMSTKSLGDNLKVPVMARAAILCAFCKFRKAATDPMFLVYPTGFVGGWYHTSIL